MGKRQTVDGVVERLRARLPQRLRVDALILFGSRVEGQADEWSDYDFIVVSPDFEGTPFIERGPGRRLPRMSLTGEAVPVQPVSTPASRRAAGSWRRRRWSRARMSA